MQSDRYHSIHSIGFLMQTCLISSLDFIEKRLKLLIEFKSEIFINALTGKNFR